MLQIFLLMVAGHALADYPLQGDFLARAKNHRSPIPGVPWYQALVAHSIIQGAFVGVISGSIPLGIMEAIAHVCIDYLKSEGAIGFNTDQFLHILCKVAWCGLIAAKAWGF